MSVFTFSFTLFPSFHSSFIPVIDSLLSIITYCFFTLSVSSFSSTAPLFYFFPSVLMFGSHSISCIPPPLFLVSLRLSYLSLLFSLSLHLPPPSCKCFFCVIYAFRFFMFFNLNISSFIPTQFLLFSRLSLHHSVFTLLPISSPHKLLLFFSFLSSCLQLFSFVYLLNSFSHLLLYLSSWQWFSCGSSLKGKLSSFSFFFLSFHCCGSSSARALCDPFIIFKSFSFVLISLCPPLLPLNHRRHNSFTHTHTHTCMSYCRILNQEQVYIDEVKGFFSFPQRSKMHKCSSVCVCVMRLCC